MTNILSWSERTCFVGHSSLLPVLGPYLYFRVPIFSVLASFTRRMSIQSACIQQWVNLNCLSCTALSKLGGPYYKMWTLCKMCTFVQKWSKCAKCAKVFLMFKILQNVQNCEIGWNCEMWLKLWNLVEIVMFCRNCDIWSKLWNLVKIVKFGRNS